MKKIPLPTKKGNKKQLYLKVEGAKEHNLKNISVAIPRNKLVVITGVSGSGKSSLAFDTIYAEGQRRYMESFSAYARQFVGGFERPDVEQITGSLLKHLKVVLLVFLHLLLEEEKDIIKNYFKALRNKDT